MYSEIREHMREKHIIFKCDTCDFTSSSDVCTHNKGSCKIRFYWNSTTEAWCFVEKSSNSNVQIIAEKVRFMCSSCQKYFSTDHRLFNPVYPYEMWDKLSYWGKEEIKCHICEYTDFYCSSMVSHTQNVHKRTDSWIANLQLKHTHHWNDVPKSAKCNVECKL